MRAITSRIKKLETRLTPQPNLDEYRLACNLYERRRRRLEAAGVPFTWLFPAFRPKTIRQHVDNLWALGGEIIRDLHYDPSFAQGSGLPASPVAQ